LAFWCLLVLYAFVVFDKADLDWVWIFKSLGNCGIDLNFKSILHAGFQGQFFGLDFGNLPNYEHLGEANGKLLTDTDHCTDQPV